MEAITGIRKADRGTGPTARGDGNFLTRGDVNFSPLGAPASNLQGPNFTPPFPANPSGHAGFGGALFQILRRFYGTDDIAFRFVSDEFNGKTVDNNGNIRPLIPRSFETLSEAEEENGQSRIYLGIHWSFDKTAQPSARPAVPASAQAVERVSLRRHSSEKSLAVLPMQNFSADSRHDYFADGLTEALIANLAQVNGLRVTSRTSSMHYKGQRKPLPQIARELDVHMIIEGSTVTQGDRLRVTAQLIEADTDEHLWAKTYDRPLRDILTVQADIAAAVARDVQVVLSRP